MEDGTSSPPNRAAPVTKARKKSAREKGQGKSPGSSGKKSALKDAAQPGIVRQKKSPSPHKIHPGTVPLREKKRRSQEAKSGTASPAASVPSAEVLADVDPNVPSNAPEQQPVPLSSYPTSLASSPASTSPASSFVESEEAYASLQPNTPGKADSPASWYTLPGWNETPASNAAVSHPTPTKSVSQTRITVLQQASGTSAEAHSGSEVDKRVQQLPVAPEAHEQQPRKHFMMGPLTEQEPMSPGPRNEGNNLPAQKPSKFRTLRETLSSKFRKTPEKKRPVVVAHSPASVNYKSLVELAALIIVYFIGKPLRSHDIHNACASDICSRYAAFFRDSLNYSAEPCVDFNVFACSRWKPAYDFSLDFAIDMSKTHMKFMAQHLLRGQQTFSASSKPARFLRKCMGEKENPDSLGAINEFAKKLGIAWPYVAPSTRHGKYLHPLRVVFELSMKWSIDTWLSVTMRQRPVSERGLSADFYIASTTVPSEWLNFVHTLENNNARESYYRHFCQLYGVSVPERTQLQRALAVEKYVLTTLDNAEWAGPLGVAKKTTSEIKEMTRNVTLEEWADLVRQLAVNVTDPETAHFYVTNVNLINAIDDIFYHRSCDDIMEHLAWWFAQGYSLLGSSKALLVIAGSKETAQAIQAVECYNIVAEKFGLLLNAESAATMFTAIERRQLLEFFEQLIDHVKKFTRVSFWNEEGERYVSAKFKHLLVTLWPDMEDIEDVLSFNYTDFLELGNVTEASFMDYWLQASNLLQGMSYYDYEWMQYRWLPHEARLFVYEFWANKLTVLHPAVMAPLYYTNNTELQAANYGGLGASFLSSVLGMFNPSVIDQDTNGQTARLISKRGNLLLQNARHCGSRYVAHIKEFIALATAWYAFKLTDATSGRNSRSGELVIDSFRETRSFSHDQVFFLTYCRSRCSFRSSRTCNDVLAHFGAFATAFQCKANSPMRASDKCGLLPLLDSAFKKDGLT
ncbi:hypothetical protein HPB50_013169 [Hyalomma asiaticum]|uniref:Uncharacterized protein n=1 Tax=Hyalomma asiaticum TaxID=266040 RepID=A0ACB7SCB4_HYAAI|nr:hypothetical protein HPB50_013169 [Hyalomma asiaticum]